MSFVIGEGKAHAESLKEAMEQAKRILQPGNDLAIMDDQTECVCLVYRWYPYNPARENLQYLPKGMAEKAIVSPDNTGIWMITHAQNDSEE